MLYANFQGRNAPKILEIHGGDDMYKTILVPLDGSKRAENILKHVEQLAFC